MVRTVSCRPSRAGFVGAAISAVTLLVCSTSFAQGFRAPARPGPYTVLIVRVLEADHFDARVRIRQTTNPRWDERMRLRLSNANAPSPDADRECERADGEEAREFVRRFIRGKRLQARYLRNVRQGVERVALLEVDGEDLGRVLISRGLAVPFDDTGGDRAETPWECRVD
jgi:endonuclease YncB( thermonuclease family)